MMALAYYVVGVIVAWFHMRSFNRRLDAWDPLSLGDRRTRTPHHPHGADWVLVLFLGPIIWPILPIMGHFNDYPIGTRMEK